MAAHVVHFSSAHFPTDVRIFRKQCRTLARAGFSVTLLCAGEGPRQIDGVRFRYVPRPASRVERLAQTVPRILREALRLRADLYHFHDPELIAVGLALRARGHRVVYDVHEDLPRQIQNKDYIRPALRGPVAAGAELVELGTARAFSAIVTSTPTIAARFADHPHVRAIQNFPFFEHADEGPSEGRPYAEREAKVIYVGNIDQSRGAVLMLEAMARVPAELDAHIDLVGRIYAPPGEAALRELGGPARATFLGHRPHADIRALLGQARVGLSMLEPRPNYLDAQPTKLFEYMEAGLPVVASDFPAWRRFVVPHECGLLVDPLDAGALADAITELLRAPERAEQMGARGRAAVREQFNWAREGEALVELYGELGVRPQP